MKTTVCWRIFDDDRFDGEKYDGDRKPYVRDVFHCVGDFFVYKIGDQHLKSDTNITKLSPASMLP